MLLEKRAWARLQSDWDRVVAKRRRLDNEGRQRENHTPAPGELLPATVDQSGERHLEPLERVRAFSIELGSPQGIGIDTPMVERVESGKNA